MEQAAEPLIDTSMRRGLLAMGIAGGCFTVGGLCFFGLRTAASVGFGTLVAAANLLVLAKVIRALLTDRAYGWLLVGLAKMLALFGGVGFLFHANVVGALPFVVGYASLPLGLAFAQKPLPPDGDPGEPLENPTPAMPEHSSFISYLLALFPGLSHNAHSLGTMVLSKQPVEVHHIEALATSLLVALVVLGIAFTVKTQLVAVDKAVIPEDKLSLRTFVELFVGYFYDIAKDAMGAKRAKRFFPVIGTCAMFIFFSNVLGLVPGMIPPTSSLNVTLGCSLLVFVLFNYYGIRENGIGYFKHMAGPWLGPLGLPLNALIFTIEIISTTMRLLTLAVRLMINMAVDHLVASIFIGLVALFVPVPAMILGVIVILVQTLVFCLLTSVYIGLATEHEEHH